MPLGTLHHPVNVEHECVVRKILEFHDEDNDYRLETSGSSFLLRVLPPPWQLFSVTSVAPTVTAALQRV